jgi:hypothetical protein
MAKATNTTRNRLQLLLPVGVLVSMLACGCVAKELAVPGADAIRLTRIAGEVANCTAVGNVKAHLSEQGPIVGDEAKFRNQVIGFGGNTGFVTLDGAYGTPAEGVAYRCPVNP